jgi:hypothetical protein
MTMRHALFTLILLAACGSSSKPPPQEAVPDPPEETLAGQAPVTMPGAGDAMDDAARVCAKLLSLRDSGCPYLVEEADFELEECKTELRQAQAEDDPFAMAVAACFHDGADCASSEQCIEEIAAAAAGDGGQGPQRQSAPAGPYFAQIKSTKALPIEVCGVEGQVLWLMDARCNDGTNPYDDFVAAHEARVGSMGQGGKNNNIIDLYEVQCPEATYKVYMDMYACP